MPFDKPDTHPSYGMIGISRVQSTGTFLVGSDFKHQHFITLTISRAERHRDLSHEWWFGNERLIQIEMSEAQFVEFIARPNMGDGVPCTLSWLPGETIEPPPAPKSQAEAFRADMKADAIRCVAELREAHAALVDAIETGKIGKNNLRDIAKKIDLAGCAISSGIPFVQKSFDEKIEATMRHAAAEIEATVSNMAMRLGVDRIRELNEAAPKLIESEKDV